MINRREKENLVPYYSLYFQTADGKTYNVSSLENYLGFTNKKQIGVSSIDVESDMNSIKVNVKMFIGEGHILDADLGEGILYEMLKLQNKWTLEFGWAAGIDGEKRIIRNMRLIDEITIDFDKTNRGYELTIDLMPAFSHALGEINIHMLEKLKKNLKAEKNLLRRVGGFVTNIFGNNDPSPLQPRTPMSLAKIISEVLDECREVITNWAPETDVSDFIPEKASAADNYQPKRHSSRFPDLPSRRQVEEIAPFNPSEPSSTRADIARQRKEIEDQIELLATYASDSFRALTVDDIPEISDFRFSISKDTADECDNLINSIFNNTAVKRDTIDKLTDTSMKNMNVMQFLTGLLADNGFSIHQSLGLISESGRLEFLVFNSDMFGKKSSVVEREYKYITSEKYERVSGGDTLGVTFVDKSGHAFDLRSRFNRISTITASIQNGETNLIAAIAEAKFMEEGSGSMMENIDSYYQLLASRSKSISITTYGMPKAKAWDDISINFIGKLLTGLYKIMKISHTISDSNFETSLELTQVTERIEPNPEKNISYSDEFSDLSDAPRILPAGAGYQELPIVGRNI
jgi:hypothetical protein